MNMEIERKFLVANQPDLNGLDRALIRQGYLTSPRDSTELRLRQMNDTYFLTLKGSGGVARVEREVEISGLQFETFWPETEGRRLEKERYTGILSDGHRFELDVFLGVLAPLQLVEVEFASEVEARAFAPADWFGRDVTEDERYRNRTLAIEGIPT